MDKRFIDRAIYHRLYGRGLITRIINDDITVEFPYQDMIFTFPDVFEDGTLAAGDADFRSYVQRFLARGPHVNVPGQMLRYSAIPVVFLNIAWMKWYDGVTNDIPVNGGKYIAEHHHGNEVNNFTPRLAESGEENEVGEWLFGTFETKSTNDQAHQAHIEKIAGCQDLKNEDCAEGVLVIWCATAPDGGRRVVGWYRDATVCRYYESMPVEKIDGSTWDCLYNVFARAEGAVLLPEKERFKEKWSVPGHTRKGDNLFGFGQANIWYASEPAAEEYVTQLVKSINEYEGHSFQESYKARIDSLDDGTLAERPDYKGVSENRKQAIQEFRNDILMDVRSKDFPRTKQVQWLQHYYDDKDSRNKLTDKQVLTTFLKAGANLIDDEGQIYSEQPKARYKVNGLSFCCGHELNNNEGENSFTCSVCGNEYESTERID